MTNDAQRTVVEAIVECELFARLNTAAAEKEDLAARLSNAKIWIATVVDKFRAAATGSAVDNASRVQAKQV